MKLDFSKPFLLIDGTEAKNPDGSVVVLKTVLANNLVSKTGKDNIIKIFDWALTVQKTGFLELDKADQTTLRELIEKDEHLTYLGKGRLLEILDQREIELKKVN